MEQKIFKETARSISRKREKERRMSSQREARKVAESEKVKLME